MSTPFPPSTARLEPASAFRFESAAAGHVSRNARDWSDILRLAYFPLDIKVGPDFRSGVIERVDIGGIRACTLQCDPMTAERHRSLTAADEQEFYVVEIPQLEPVQIRQRGRENCVQPGDFTIVNGAEPYVFTTLRPNTVRTLRIPSRALRQRLPGLDDQVASTCAGAQPCTPLFLDFATSYFRHALALPPDAQRRIEQHLLDLLVMALIGADTESGESSVRGAHRQRALRCIEERFTLATLQPADIARAIGVSERYLQRILADRHETVTSLIRQRRLLEAKRLLGERRQNGLSVTQIAFIVGFSDPAHFSRVFRRETGVAPVRYEAPASPVA
ncbi:AraC family transcriptional regulator [Burkholderia pseudomultivorans]|uniref:AraC family regulatory protein n=1 Tax=Burkholderia pseudomultivorans TaxID=1207504 RepID=A0A6P2I8D1_9BURK|nr:AraC family transcriptional regulator [Burkholderia pseudomultivorans]MDR8729950.1 Transcriptional activator NphR [Burkholderia pseudomultivorans]MDR8735792.1 Transcriptional activator NphR [Burkholderia pseudomultivorans]MDR8744394.1 Transcriptional activator NphR [Burkholderia pseudomultivorans]MDR8756152.1 Transcriptional activator NphR [Burkholderia pseudomultivorans]MDR8780947.1 Transcriptional activator NphR [Burkholderia pseudomultivorans]